MAVAKSSPRRKAVGAGKKAGTGSTVLLEALRREGVEVIFGYPGGSVLPLFDDIYKEKFPFILSRHEQGSTHMADGYARASGKPGVVIVTSGPGATNTVTGLATAMMDSVPVIVITGQVPVAVIGNDAFQEADVVGITRPITKYNYLVKSARDLPRVIREAFHIATTGRPGPVVIDLPKDVQTAPAEMPEKVEMNLPGYKPSSKGNPRQIERAARLINEAERPVLYAGGGVISSGATGELAELARKAQIPVTTTLLGLGAFPETDPLSLQMLGMHGTACANAAVSNCDLLIAVGARFDVRITGDVSRFSLGSKKIQIDIDPTSVGKSVQVEIPVVGDAKKILAELVGKVTSAKHDDWLARIDAWKKKYPLAYGDGEIPPQFVVEKICEATGGKAIIATDVGQHQMWAAQFYRYSAPRSFLSSGGLGTMGYGFPAAIGAKVACPERDVVCISGDGSFQMQLQQLATAVTCGIAVKIALLNNGFLGMVRQWQEMFYEGRYSQTELVNPDFVRIAEAYGAEGSVVEKREDVLPTLKKALASPGPVLMDFRVTREENVYPMVPPGGAISEVVFPGGVERL